jgi:hypothetical protein
VPLISGSSGGGGGAISGVTVTGTAVSGEVPVASSASAGAWAFQPGFEIGYTQITSSVNVVSTTEAAGTTIFSPGALPFDGSPVICEVFCFAVTPSAATSSLTLCLFEGAIQITRLAQFATFQAAVLQSVVSLPGIYRFTPSVGSHTYTVTSFVSTTTGTPNVGAGPGGTAGTSPAFVRFTKV